MPIRNKFVYICSPLAGDMDDNMEKARHYCRATLKEDPTAIPIAPHIYFTQFTDDNNPAERAADIDMGLALLAMCSEIRVYGIENPSEGMKIEIQYAKAHGIKIIPKPRLLNTPAPVRAKPALDADAVRFWKNTYLELNQTCSEFYGDAHLVRKLADLEGQENEYDNKSDKERADYYACVKALQEIVQEKNLISV